MKITIDSEQLKVAFGKCASVVSPRSPKEVLQNVLFRELDGVLTLTGTNTETSVIAELTARVERPGAMLLPAERLSRFVKEFHGEISLSLEGNEVVFSAPNAKFNIPTGNAQEFPAPPLLATEATEVDSEMFCKAIRKTIFACDVDSARFALGGVRIDDWNVVATDGRRMSHFDMKLPGETRLLVPEKAALIIVGILTEEKAYISSDLSNVQVRCGKFTLNTRQLEGRYPDWRNVLPSKEGRNKATLAAGSLFSAIRQAAIVSDSESRAIEFRFEDGMIHLKAQAAEKGQAAVSTPAEYSGAPTATKLDHKYCEDFLRACDASDIVSLYIGQPTESVLFEDSAGTVYMIAPMAMGK